MFAMGVIIAVAILVGGLFDITGERSRALGGVLSVAMLALAFLVLAAPVYAAQPDSSVHKVVMKFGPANFSMTMTPSGELKVVADGNTVSVKLDTTIFPPESLEALFDSISEVIDSEMVFLKASGLDTLQPDSLAAAMNAILKGIAGLKGVSISGKPAVKVFSTGAVSSGQEKSEEREGKSGGVGEFISSVFDSFSDILVLLIIFLSGLLMILGVPIILGLLLYYRWRWAHQERMKALEMGTALPVEPKNGANKLRTGMAIFGLGMGIMLGVLLHQGFWFLLGAAFFGWGMGLVSGYYVSRQEKEREHTTLESQFPGGEDHQD